MKKKRWIAAGLGAAIAGSAFMLHDPVPKFGKEALAYANEAIEERAVSLQMLEEELESEFSRKAADYALELVSETDWQKEADEAFDEAVKPELLSEKGVDRELSFLGFTDEEVQNALANGRSRTDYQMHAENAAQKFLSDPDSEIHRKGLREHLQGKEFTDAQISGVLDAGTIKWASYLSSHAEKKLETPVSEAALKKHLSGLEFTDQEIEGWLKENKPDFQDHCTRYISSLMEKDPLSEKAVRRAARESEFTDKQVEAALEKKKTDWNYQAVKAARNFCEVNELSSPDLKERLLTADFTEKQADFVLKHYDEENHKIPDESTIKEKIKKEEAERKKAEEEARKKAEEEKRKQEEEAARKAEEERKKQEAAEAERIRQEQEAAEAERIRQEQEAAEAERIRQEQEAAAAVPSEPVGSMVWIPKTGKKYHSYAGCSNMKNPTQVTLQHAEAYGYGRCSKCW